MKAKNINIKKTVDLFGRNLLEGEYTLDRSKNTEIDYHEEKLDRDNKAVKDFLTTNIFTLINEQGLK